MIKCFKKISVVAVDDNISYLCELSRILKSSPDVEYIDGYNTKQKALESLPFIRPDVVLLDLNLNSESGLEIINNLKAKNIDLNFIVLTVYDDDESLFSALEAGASGYILKDEVTRGSLVENIKEYMNGGAPMSNSIARRILKSFESDKIHIVENINLTEREREILAYLSEGYRAKKIAGMLSIAYSTVRCHQKNIYKKLQVNSDLEAVCVYRDSQKSTESNFVV